MAFRFRSFVLITHRWLGLTSSVVVSIVGLTGAILVWPGTSLLKRVAARFTNGSMGKVGWLVARHGHRRVTRVGRPGSLVEAKDDRGANPSGWRQGLFDIHHAAGPLACRSCSCRSRSGMAFVTPTSHPALRRVIFSIG
jgi:hypothetical protein